MVSLFSSEFSLLLYPTGKSIKRLGGVWRKRRYSPVNKEYLNSCPVWSHEYSRSTACLPFPGMLLSLKEIQILIQYWRKPIPEEIWKSPVLFHCMCFTRRGQERRSLCLLLLKGCSYTQYTIFVCICIELRWKCVNSIEPRPILLTNHYQSA